MKKTFLAALCAVAAGCGGSSSLDPTTVKFSYGTGAAVTVGSPESYAADAGEMSLSDAEPLTTTQNQVEADTRAGSMMSLADNMSNECFDASGSTPMRAAQLAVTRKVVGLGVRGVVPAAFDPACVIVIPGKITYNHCVDSITNPDGTSESYTIDGSITRTVAVGTASASWDVSVHATLTDVDMSMNMTDHFTGGLALTATTLTGNSRSDVTFSIAAQGMNMSGAYSNVADYDLQFVTGPFCVTGGTLELRRVWTKRPTGSTTQDMPNQGIKFTWTGCGAATAAWGTQQ
jgi:hypothetical protein